MNYITETQKGNPIIPAERVESHQLHCCSRALVKSLQIKSSADKVPASEHIASICFYGVKKERTTERPGLLNAYLYLQGP